MKKPDKSYFYGKKRSQMWCIDTAQLEDARIIPHIEALLREDLIDESREKLEKILKLLIN
jgi:hypothetical protein